MRCLIALDGLSEGDLPAVILHLPQSRLLVESLYKLPIKFSSNSAQSNWAEILTGTNTFKNGCAGYAHPSSSLNSLTVFTESDLLEPARLVEPDDGLTSVVINVPVLLPKPETRLWLADGSLPINRFVSPSELRSNGLFKQYSPRPYKSHAGATTLPQLDLMRRCIELETQRLSCAVSLYKQKNWSKFVYRVSLFDHLFHLIGLNFLSAKDLSIFDALMGFLVDFDNAIQLFSSSKLSFVSCYSHTACRTTLNLNLLLAQGGFLQLTSEASAPRAQSERLKVATTMWQPSTHYMTTMEGRLQTSSTTAASPISGCVYVNKSSVFADGIVSDSDYQKVREEVSNYLQNLLSRRFGNRFSLAVHPDEFNHTCAPDLIVNIEGVEFQNLSESSSPVTPLTTHSATGFALIPQQLQSSKITATDLASLLNA